MPLSPSWPDENVGDQAAICERSTGKPAISVIGLGYVGAVSMACLSHLGFRMVGVDVTARRSSDQGAASRRSSKSGSAICSRKASQSGLIDATQNLRRRRCSIPTSRFCRSARRPRRTAAAISPIVRQASRAIGQALALKSGYHVVVLRCSVPPGTTLDVVVPEIETGIRQDARPRFRRLLQSRIPARRRRRRRLLRAAEDGRRRLRRARRSAWSPASTEPSTRT